VPEQGAGQYGRNIADDYDAIYGEAFDTEAAVDRLAELADGDRVLELGIGTGRLALPLSKRGLIVHGVDGSERMLRLLSEKPGGDAIPTTLADFADVRLDPPGQFALVVLAINTIFALDPEAKIRCFATAAYHLRPHGRFVVEAWVPPHLPAGQSLQPRTLSPGYVGIVAADHDPSTQTLSTTQIVLGGPSGVHVFPVVHQYASPFELDLMARLASMTLEQRWADWRCTPFGATSTDHVSIYTTGPSAST
jgi:SAM-dependent methyltransferase